MGENGIPTDSNHLDALWAVFKAGGKTFLPDGTTSGGHAFNIAVGPNLQIVVFEPQHSKKHKAFGNYMVVKDGEYLHPKKGHWAKNGEESKVMSSRDPQFWSHKMTRDFMKVITKRYPTKNKHEVLELVKTFQEKCYNALNPGNDKQEKYYEGL